MDIIPVLDILNGQVVRGVAGRRTEYHRIVSKLTTSSAPLVIASVLRETFGLSRFYVADLDGIVNQRPNLRLFSQLADQGFELLVDAGTRGEPEAVEVASRGKADVIIGLESCRSPEDLKRILDSLPTITFSLDLLNGLPRMAIDAAGWCDQPEAIAEQLVEEGVSSLLILDLADVGMSTGGSTDRLCRFARSRFPDLHLISGGGVRNRDDLSRFCKLGVDAVLVASALHDGQLSREDLIDFHERP